MLDLPPGTGDIQLTLCQQLAISGENPRDLEPWKSVPHRLIGDRGSFSGAVVVTTPQRLALIDVVKGVS